MLEKLLAKNFQCHKRLEVSFDPRVTVLCGPSDAGKSALLRLLRWIATNRPNGDSYLRHGADYVAGHLWLDGRKIQRERAGGDNSYWLDGNKYQAFGQGVPEDVLNVLNISPTSFQMQHDPVFHFSLSPGEVSRELNAVVNLDLIDSTLANLNLQHKRARDTLRVSEERLAAASARRDNLAWVKEADTCLQKVEEAERTWQRTQDDANDLEVLLNEINQLVEQIDQARVAIISREAVVTAGQAAATAQEEVDDLASLLEEIATCRARVTDSEQEIACLEEQLHGLCPNCGRPMAARV